ncbi:MAG: hypothetical protein ACYC4Q_02450 [Victivallaceae bacterium]
MKRRDFIKIIGVLYSYSLIANGRAFGNDVPESVVEAVRSRRYPGRIKKLDFKTIKKQGGWQG